MAKVAFYNVPAHGHINPSLPVVTTLVQRGEHVVYYAHEDFRGKIQATGAEFRPLSHSIPYDHTRPARTLVHLAETVLRFGWEFLPRILDEARREQFDYMMHDCICPWGRFVAQILGAPSICSTVTCAIHPTMLRTSIGPKPLLRVVFRGGPAFARFQRLAWRLRRRYGLTRLGVVDVLTNPTDLTLVYTTREFQPRPELFDARYHFVGPSVPDSQDPAGFPLAQLEGKSVIYISLGTIHNDRLPFYQACLAAFAGLPHTVVMSIGKKLDMAALGPLPENFIVRPAVPQIEVLKHTRVFLSHGGGSSTNESLYYGVPMVVYPTSTEQYIQGRRVAELGAGRILWPRQVSPEKIRGLTLDLLGDENAFAAARRIQTSFRAAGGHQRAVEEILRHTRARIAAQSA